MTKAPYYNEDGWMVRTTAPGPDPGQPVLKDWYAAARTREEAEVAVRARQGAQTGEEVATLAMVAADKMEQLRLAAGQVVALVPDPSSRPRSGS